MRTFNGNYTSRVKMTFLFTLKNMSNLQMTVPLVGPVQAIAPNDFSFLESIGQCTARRASHVEPVPVRSELRWQADLGPVGGPVLGPFASRAEAMEAEILWLGQQLGRIQFRYEQ